MSRWRLVLIGVAAAIVGGLAAGANQLPSIGAGGLLYPARRRVEAAPPPTCRDATFTGDAVSLRGWQCRTTARRRGAMVYLHGVADNRSSATGIIERFGRQGFVVLLGTSLGAAVAIQEAAHDPRVSAIVAVETFSDLRTVATERAPVFFTSGIIDRAFELAELRGHFRVDAVSPVQAAAGVSPVLLIHGEADVDTRPEHSRRVLAALAGPKRLILVPGARHNESLRGDVWGEIEHWLDAIVPRRD